MSLTRPDHVPADRVVDVNIYALPGQEEDFHAAWHSLQQNSPGLVWTPQNEGHWIALRGDLLAEVQSDHERFSNRVIVIPKSVGEKHGLIPTTIDPPEHRPYRIILNTSMSPAVVRQMQAQIRATAAELVEGFLKRGRCDFTAEFARVFPIRIFMAMVDIPMADAEEIRFWAECMTRPNPPMPFGEAKAAFYDYLAPVIAKRRVAPGEDVISHIVTADVNGRAIENDEALSLATQILIAGVDTVVNFLGFALHFLATNAEARAELARDPASVPMAAQELFRRFGLVTIARTVRADMEFDGVPLKAGELVCIPTQVHGLDDQINADPMRVDFSRKRSHHSTFGSGPHMCPGQELARAEVSIAIQEWLARIPEFGVAKDADTRCSGGIVGQLNRLVLEWETE